MLGFQIKSFFYSLSHQGSPCHSYYQFSSVAQSCPTSPMDCSMAGLPVHHQLLDWVSDAIQPSHPLLSPSPSTFNFPQHQCLFNWDRSFHQMAKILEFVSTSVLPMNTQEWFPLGWTGWISLLSKGFSRVFSNTTAQKHQLFGAQLSSQSSSHIQTGKTIALTRQILLAK